MAGEFHEPREQLTEGSLDIKRAIDSMMEELEAVDWYRQRMQGASDPALRAVLDHHQREEVEHFAMLLEWVRRKDAVFNEQLRTYLFTRGDILEVEEASEAGGEGSSSEAAAAEAPAGFPPPDRPARTPIQPPQGAVGRDTPQSSSEEGISQQEDPRRSRRRTLGSLREAP